MQIFLERSSAVSIYWRGKMRVIKRVRGSESVLGIGETGGESSYTFQISAVSNSHGAEARKQGI